MNKTVMYAIKAFINLSETEKAEFIEQVNKYQDGLYIEKRQINEEIEKSLQRTGPLNIGNCPICGK